MSPEADKALADFRAERITREEYTAKIIALSSTFEGATRTAVYIEGDKSNYFVTARHVIEDTSDGKRAGDVYQIILC